MLSFEISEMERNEKGKKETAGNKRKLLYEVWIVRKKEV